MRKLLRLDGTRKLLWLLVLTSCAEDVRMASGRIEGVVWASGPLEGAVVRAYSGAEQVGESAPTDASGAFTERPPVRD